MQLFPPTAAEHLARLARWTLSAFLLTFLLSRVLVLLIMSRRIPDFFLFVGQTHVHHLNYGIFLLVAVAGWLLFVPPTSNHLQRRAAILYGIGLGLTFDEFGMWLHLGGSYWQRTSYDAIVIVALILGLLAFGAGVRKLQLRGWLWLAVTLLALAALGYLTFERVQEWSPQLELLEDQFPH
jgi:hypothetical protein